MNLLYGALLLVGMMVLSIFVFNALKAKHDRQKIKKRFFHDYPDALLDIPKNRIRDGLKGGRLEPTLAMEPLQPSTENEFEKVPECSAVFALPGQSEKIAEEVKSTQNAQDTTKLFSLKSDKNISQVKSNDYLEQENVVSVLPKAINKTLLDPAVDFIADIFFDQPKNLMTLPCFTTTRRSSVMGYTIQENWQPANTLSETRYTALKIGLQTVDRNGAISYQELEKFSQEVTEFAAQVIGHVAMPSLKNQLAISEALDHFCEEVDVLINIHIVFDKPIAGASLYRLLIAAKLSLESDGIFHRLSEEGETLYTISDDNVSFDKDHLSLIQINTLTLLFDVPHIKGGIDRFDEGLYLAKNIAKQLDGSLVDDNQHLLTESGITKIREQLMQIYQQMQDQGIDPGSALSNRLFI